MQMNENSTADSLSENYLIYPSMKFYFLNLLTLASPVNRITTLDNRSHCAYVQRATGRGDPSRR